MSNQIVSRLLIQASSQGLDAVVNEINRLKLSKEGLAKASDNVTKVTESYQRRLDSIQRSLDINFRNMQNMERVERDLGRAREQGLISAQRQNELLEMARQKYGEADQGASGYSSSLTRVAAALAAAAVAALSFSRFIDAGRQYTDLQNSLRVAGLEGEQLTATFNNLFAAAQRQGAPIEALTSLFSRVSQSAGELNTNTAEIERFSEGVAVALRVAGTNATQAQGALTQLAQALGGGTVRAEEFNSVNEGARPILQAVAAGMEEAGGSVARLRQLVIDGKVSSEAFFRAFQAGRPILDDMASRAVPTVSQGISRLNNSFVNFVGEADKVIGATAGLARALEGVSRWIDAVGVPSALAFASAFMDTLPRIGEAALAAGGVLAAAFAPAAIMGGIALISGAVTALGAAFMGLAAIIAANPLAALAIGLAAAAAAVVAFRDQINQYLGVDVMQIARDTANGVIGLFVGAFQALIAAAREIPAAFRNAFADAMNGAIEVVQRGINTILGILRNVPFLGERIGGVDLSGARFERGPDSNVLGAAGAVFRGAQGDFVGAIGARAARVFSSDPTVARATGARPSINRIRAADYEADNDNETGGRGRGAGRQERDALQEEIRRLDERTAAIQTATNVIGLDTFAREKALAVQRLMSVAARDGTAATQDEIKVIEDKATAYARAQAAAEEAQRSQRQYQDLFNTSRQSFTGFFSDFANQIGQGKTIWQAFASSALSALQRVASKMLDIAATNVFQQFFGSGFGGGGMFGGLGGGLFGLQFLGGGAGPLNILPGGFAKGGAFNDNGIIPFARGGSFTNSIVNSPTLFPFANGTGLMGEAGPEAIVPLSRGSDGRLGVTMQGVGGAVAVTFAPNITVSVQGSNSSSGDIGGAVAQAVKAAKDEFERDLPAMIDKAKRRGALAA